MPCGVVSSSSENRDSPLSGLEDFAFELGTDPTANEFVSHLLDVNALLADSLKLEGHDTDSDISAMVTKSLSRSEMLASAEALSADRKEADGLVNAGTQYGSMPTCAPRPRNENKCLCPLWASDDHCFYQVL